ncbi:MAG: tripartite tricarboxylate transporter substrate binding protein [Comamonadaceae bacterium]|nr:MAG: tripartite tricarboxylate transporter substrate binding protein [Comamonadaceae bacterium]
MNEVRREFLCSGLATALLLGTGQALAQSPFPSQPIQLVHGFGAGGNADVVARLVAQKLAGVLGQPVVVEIKSGAGGSIASSYVAKAKPDGHTLVMLTGAHTVSAALSKNLPYDPVKDFAFISTVSSFPFVVAVRAEHPAQTLGDLLAIARKEPGKVSFTSVGIGSTQHMVGELLGATAGVRLLHIPYRGGGAPVQAVIGGDVDVLADTLTVASPHIRSGRLRALGVTSAQPWPGAPGVPTVAATLPGFEVRSWLGLAAPAGTPQAVVQRLNAELRKALADPEFEKALSGLGSETAPRSSADTLAMVQRDIARWRDVAVRAGLTSQ